MDRPIARNNKKKKITILVVACCMAVASVVFYAASHDWSSRAVDGDRIRIGTVYQGDLVVEVVGSGRVMPYSVEWIVTRVAGSVIEVNVEAGDHVKEGQVLLRLRDDELNNELAQKKSRVAEATAVLSGMELELQGQEMEFRSQVAQAKFKYQADKVVYEAYEMLMLEKNPPISRLDFHRAKVAYESQKQMHEVMLRQYENFKGLKEAKLNAYRFRLDLAKQERDQYLTRVQDLTITARKTGVIQDIDLKVGQQVIAGESIGKIVDPGDLFVRLEVPAIESYKIARGQPARVTINREVIEGEVIRIDPNVRGTTIEVDVRLIDQAAFARIDMFVNARIIVSRIENTLIVDRPSTVVENGIIRVYKLDTRGARADLIEVRTGAVSSNEVQVIGGLATGDRIVLSELQGMRGVESIRIN